MNGWQRATMVIALFVAIGVGLVPPWVEVFSVSSGGRSIHQETPVGFQFIFAPPQPSNPLTSYRIDTQRLLVLWSIVAMSAVVLVLVLRSRRSPT